MARTITRVALRSKIRLRGELGDDNSLYWTSAMLNDWIDDSWARLYDILATADPERFLSSSNVSVVSGTGSYACPADFYRELALWVPEPNADSDYIQLERIKYEELFTVGDPTTEKADTYYYVRGGYIYLHPTPSWTATAIFKYIAAPAALAGDSSTIDSVNLWTDWLVLDVLHMCALREKDVELAREFAKQRRIVEEGILVRPEGNQGHAARVVNMQF